MNKAERELFAIFIAEIMGNKALLDELYPELGLRGDEGIAVGRRNGNEIIWYDDSKQDPAVIRENVLEKRDKKRKQ